LFFPSSTLSAAEDKQILKEIIVVDDGSRPPLRKIMSEQLLSGGPGVPKMKIVRHEHTLGLISAKKSGDVFFC
jgi:glycosyltransferase involved in cell wall biosynthesis